MYISRIKTDPVHTQEANSVSIVKVFTCYSSHNRLIISDIIIKLEHVAIANILQLEGRTTSVYGQTYTLDGASPDREEVRTWGVKRGRRWHTGKT